MLTGCIVDRAMHVLDELMNDIKWNDWRIVGIDDDYHDWYYVEDELYVIRDRILGYLKFVKASSPVKAYEIWQDEVRSIAIGVDEE